MEIAAIHGNKLFIRHIIERDKKQKWSYGAVSLNMFLLRDFDTYKTLVCDRNALEARIESEKISYLQYFFQLFEAKTRSRPSVEPNVLDLLVEYQHKSLLTTLPLVQGLLDHKWNTFARQLLVSWGFITLIMFIVFEINVYQTASQMAMANFTTLEFVRGTSLKYAVNLW